MNISSDICEILEMKDNAHVYCLEKELNTEV